MGDEALLSNLQNELRRGTQILSVLSQLEKMQYGYSLLQKLEAMNVAIEAGTLYPLLRRLETQELLVSEWDVSESRPRKYYYLSENGKIILEALKNEWNQIVQEMDNLLRGNHNE